MQHDRDPGGEYDPDTPGWQIARRMAVDPEDRRIRKRANESFQDTELEPMLREHDADRAILAG